MSDMPLLSFVVWLPILGGVLVVALKDAVNPRPLALAVAMITFMTSL
jgi:NADH-quinone oxidoreductase subunit M